MSSITFQQAKDRLLAAHPQIELLDYNGTVYPCTIQCGVHGKVRCRTYKSILESKHGCPECGKEASVLKRAEVLSTSLKHKNEKYRIYEELLTELHSLPHLPPEEFKSRVLRLLADCPPPIKADKPKPEKPKTPLPDGISPVPGYESLYGVTDTGCLYNLTTHRRIKGTLNAASNSVMVVLNREGQRKAYALHHLVLMSFPPYETVPGTGRTVRHLDGDPWNNSLSNLRIS
ncbi:DUF723 domain-containing protein [Neisseria leonii]|uniref:DUF723 domain-containing protein n=1 Tax=Neisseria leonii TaxID=2995413 RepID=UPI00345F84DF